MLRFILTLNMRDISILNNNGVDLKSSLEIFGTMDSYEETLVDFLTAITQKKEELEKYKELSDMANYAIYAHSVKSDARYLGFTSLATIALNHELKGKANDSVYVYSDYDNFINEIDKFIKITNAYLNSGNNENIKADSRKAILVADDSLLIRNLISKMISDEYEVIIAEDGSKAIENIKNNNDLFGILLDLNMPNTDGFAVLEYLKSNGLKVPVAIITGDDSKETIDRAFTYTIVDVLNKPFNEMNIKRVITSMENFK